MELPLMLYSLIPQSSTEILSMEIQKYDSVQIFQTTTYSNKSNIEEKCVILLTNLFFTTMVMAASSDNDGFTRQGQ
jgi:hypothetical protein